jgi:hypothetical protein
MAFARRSPWLLCLILAGQLPLWRRIAGRDQTWQDRPGAGKAYVCIGCGRERVKVKRTYCRRCQKRLGAGIPVDVDEYLTEQQYQDWSRRVMPGRFMAEGRNHRKG